VRKDQIRQSKPSFSEVSEHLPENLGMAEAIPGAIRELIQEKSQPYSKAAAGRRSPRRWREFCGSRVRAAS